MYGELNDLGRMNSTARSKAHGAAQDCGTCHLEFASRHHDCLVKRLVAEAALAQEDPQKDSVFRKFHDWDRDFIRG